MPDHVCPPWLGYVLASPIRKLLQNPTKILSPYIHAGMTVLDVGSAMGFFTIPLAHLVGPKGKVIAVDMQEKMLKGLANRAAKAGVTDVIDSHLSLANSLGLPEYAGKIDFALTFAVVHEMPDANQLFSELAILLKSGGTILLAEPTGHVDAPAFAKTLAKAQEQGFILSDQPNISRSHTALLKKP
jgi:ubiquinone/menaquinone biosynthesis C-methylase UbiE